LRIIKKITLSDIGSLKIQSEKEGLLFPKKEILFIGMYEDERLIAWGGINLKKRPIFKCDYVIPEYRRQGIGKQFITYRLKLLKELGYKTAEANATKLALNGHLRNGAKINKKYKNGITQVIYENL
jgi:GNAT superfamily N-acetyltransferase